MKIEEFKKYIKEKNKSYLIFDFDKTIAKLVIDWGKCHPGVVEIYKKYDPTFKYKGGRVDVFLNDYIKKYGKSLRDDVVEFNYNFEKDLTEKLEPNESLIEYIKNENELTLYILTSNDSKNVSNYLSELNLKDNFKKVVGRDHVQCIKPDPEGMKMILDDDKDLKKYLMIGDSGSDKGVASVVGMDFYLIDHFD